VTDQPETATDPQPREVPLDATMLARLIELEIDVKAATDRRDHYQEGLVTGLGIAMGDVIGMDATRGVLLLRPEDGDA
jgi:hypothetical protein